MDGATVHLSTMEEPMLPARKNLQAGNWPRVRGYASQEGRRKSSPMHPLVANDTFTRVLGYLPAGLSARRESEQVKFLLTFARGIY